ncbi:MAG: hypothetical protein MK188_09495 [Gammaproteobacteria bacterium]|nr:hypothetical protein [Gammaproteobacteria bacterium]
MSLLVLPALLALLIKLGLIYIYRKSVKGSTCFLVMVVVFALHNLCEVLAFWEFFHGLNGEFLLKTYHVISLTSLLVICWTVNEVSEIESRNYLKFYGFLVALASSVIVFTDHVISGAGTLSYVITAERGPLYSVFQIMALSLIVMLLYQIYIGYSQAKTHSAQIKSAYMGIALLPQVAAVVIVIIMMNMKLPINGAVIFPLATSLFVFILLAAEHKHQIMDVRRFIPFSDERKTSNQIMDIFSKYAQDRASYREAVNDIEKLLVEHKYEKNDRNATYAAQKMGMPRSSLYSLFNRLGVKKQD